MRRISRVSALGLLAAASFLPGAAPAAAVGALSPSTAAVSNGDATVIEIGRRWYPEDDDYYYPPEYYLPPPPPPPAAYRDAPPLADYQPPVYGWISVPPAPASCGKYRYWNGERCADARYDPPYIGPRW